MPVLSLTLNLDENPWNDLAGLREQGKLITAMGEESGPIRIGGLPNGMESGATAVEIALRLPDGTLILTETSLKLFLAAADALRVVYPKG